MSEKEAEKPVVEEESQDDKMEVTEENEPEEIKQEDEETASSTPAPTPSRRGGKRSRKRRGGGRRPALPKFEALSKAIIEASEKEANEVKPDDGEIEVTQTKEAEVEIKKEETSEESVEENPNLTEDDENDEEEEQREPSPVMTRRSNRKIQQQKGETEVLPIPPSLPPTVDEIKTEVGPDNQETVVVTDILDQDEVESVTSELDSIASESTLTTRSRRRGKTSQDNQTKITKKGPGKASTKKSANNTNTNYTNSTSTKGKSRRIIFKKSATRAPTAVARAMTSDRIYFKGQYFTRGDIVSVQDVDGSIYYAQLRGFLTDQYCEKSGVITWLLPTVHSPPPEVSFDPSTYVVGPEEELPRRLDYFTFVMHAPDDYYYYKKAPYPTMSIQTDQEYLMTRQGPRIRMIKAGKPVYQETIPPLIPMEQNS